MKHSTTDLLISRWIASIEYPCAASRFRVLADLLGNKGYELFSISPFIGAPIGVPIYKRKENILSLDNLCFDVEDVDTCPDRWYAMQGWVSDLTIAHDTLISPGWMDE